MRGLGIYNRLRFETYSSLIARKQFSFDNDRKGLWGLRKRLWNWATGLSSIYSSLDEDIKGNQRRLKNYWYYDYDDDDDDDDYN